LGITGNVGLALGTLCAQLLDTAVDAAGRLVTARSTANHVACEDLPPVFLDSLLSMKSFLVRTNGAAPVQQTGTPLDRLVGHSGGLGLHRWDYHASAAARSLRACAKFVLARGLKD
jgi:hypothetical protein